MTSTLLLAEVSLLAVVGNKWYSPSFAGDINPARLEEIGWNTQKIVHYTRLYLEPKYWFAKERIGLNWLTGFELKFLLGLRVLFVELKLALKFKNIDYLIIILYFAY